MKALFSRFIIAIMILATLSIVLPVSAGLSDNYENETNLINEAVKRDKRKVTSACHINDIGVAAASCCYTECDIKYAPFFSVINTWLSLHSSFRDIVVPIHLHQIYITPANPPPIFS